MGSEQRLHGHASLPAGRSRRLQDAESIEDDSTRAPFGVGMRSPAEYRVELLLSS